MYACPQISNSIVDGAYKVELDNGTEKLIFEDECENYTLTAYTWTGNRCADGSWPEEGITVASNKIPLGTWIYISGYGVYQVRDCGGMSNSVIDIYLDEYEDCINFGRVRNVPVFIID